jgi:ribosomal protein L31
VFSFSLVWGGVSVKAKQKLVDTAGRVERFQKKYANRKR